jgi:hypothetical protein
MMHRRLHWSRARKHATDCSLHTVAPFERVNVPAQRLRSIRRAGPRWHLLLKASSEHSAKSEGMICPITLWRGRGCYLLNTPPQPKHDARPCPVGCCFLTEVLLQALP